MFFLGLPHVRYCYPVTLHRSVSLCVGMSAWGYIILQKFYLQLFPCLSFPNQLDL